MRHQNLKFGGHFSTAASPDHRGVLLQLGEPEGGLGEQVRVLLTPEETDYLISDLKAMLHRFESRKI